MSHLFCSIGFIPTHRPRRKLIVFELCAEDITACRIAREGGANRIELCSRLDAGGLTPPQDLMTAAIEHSGLPVHIMLRPRAGDFCYSDAEFAFIREGFLRARAAGAAGVVAGFLTPDNEIDIARTFALVKLAHPMEVTFHRAFDLVRNCEQALEQVIACGCHRILTSGGAPDVLIGAHVLRQLVRQASGRICIAVGGGLNLANAHLVSSQTGAEHFHASMRGVTSNGDRSASVSLQDICDMTRILRESCGQSQPADDHLSTPRNGCSPLSQLAGS